MGNERDFQSMKNDMYPIMAVAEKQKCISGTVSYSKFWFADPRKSPCVEKYW